MTPLLRVLIADDDPFFRTLLQDAIAPAASEVVTVSDGLAAMRILEGADAPPLAVLDWVMPGLDGAEICRRLRARPPGAQTYVILITSRERTEDLVAGLEAGADDYVTKPFAPEELRARVRVGARVVTLQRTLMQRVRDLEDALANVKRLQGLLSICAYCKKVRDDRNYWSEVESYIAHHSDVRFSHAICPECYTKVVRPEMDHLLREPDPGSAA
jgi:CheY-like chemotaxis protein